MKGFRIYRTTDKVEFKIEAGDESISIFVSPLSLEKRTRLQAVMFKAIQGDMDAATEATILAFKMGLKDIKGIIDANDQEYKLSFDENGELTQECVDDLLNMQISAKIGAVCGSLIQGITGEIMGADGKPIEGISLVKKTGGVEKK